MTLAEPEALLAVARAAASAGAAVAHEYWLQVGSILVEEKAGPHDLVSIADRVTEAAILETLAERRPTDAVVAEESGGYSGRSGLRWAVDPIDGTTSFLYGRRDWSVSVAVLDEAGCILAGVVAEPAHGRVTEACAGGGTWSDGRRLQCRPTTDLARSVVEINFGTPAQKSFAGRVVGELVPVVRDIRRSGSAAAALATVAAGRADAAWLPGLQPWDCAAGILLVTESGGKVGDLSGRAFTGVPRSGDVLAAPVGLWDQLRDTVDHAVAGER